MLVEEGSMLLLDIAGSLVAITFAYCTSLHFRGEQRDDPERKKALIGITLVTLAEIGAIWW